MMFVPSYTTRPRKKIDATSFGSPINYSAGTKGGPSHANHLQQAVQGADNLSAAADVVGGVTWQTSLYPFLDHFFYGFYYTPLPFFFHIY